MLFRQKFKLNTFPIKQMLILQDFVIKDAIFSVDARSVSKKKEKTEEMEKKELRNGGEKGTSPLLFFSPPASAGAGIYC